MALLSSNILSPDPTVPIESFTERLLFGGFMLLVGMAVVFSVLIIIWGSLVLFQKVFSKDKVQEPAPAPAPAPVVVAPVTTEAEIVAVITAAIAAAEAENGNLKFRVVSFKRK